MSEHLAKCPPAEKCPGSEGGGHVLQDTVAGFAVYFCGLCIDGCICDRVRADGQHGSGMARSPVAGLRIPSGPEYLAGTDRTLIAERVRMRTGMTIGELREERM